MFKSLVSTTLALTALTLTSPGRAPVQAQSRTIVATAVAAGSFESLVADESVSAGFTVSSSDIGRAPLFS